MVSLLLKDNKMKTLTPEQLEKIKKALDRASEYDPQEGMFGYGGSEKSMQEEAKEALSLLEWM